MPANSDMTERRASFLAMDSSTPEDWAIVADHFPAFAQGQASRVLGHLRLLEGKFDGFPVDRLEHSLQTATRAYRDGRDTSYVVMALLHDVGDMLASYNHADMSAAILKTFVTEELHWICERHAIFQAYFYFHHVGLDRDMREQFRGHPHFEACAEFCEKYDQSSFDPNYASAPLKFFEPMVQAVFAKPLG